LAQTHQGVLIVVPTAEHLTLNTASGLRGGYYRDLRLVDSRGKWFRVRSARKLHGVGPVWGYNLFLNQRIRVALELDDEHRQADVAEVRHIVLKEFSAWHGWKSRGDFQSLRRRVQAARTLPDILAILAEAVTWRP
jgi:hypothetical protein